MWILYAYLVAEEPRLIDCVRSYRFLEVVLHGTITISSSRFFVLQKFTPFILSPALTHFACVEFVLLFSWPEMSRTCLVESRARSRSPVGLWGGPHKGDSPWSSLEAPIYIYIYREREREREKEIRTVYVSFIHWAVIHVHIYDHVYIIF